MISILNYGMGNLASIHNMLKKVGVASKLIATADEIRQAKALIIPGVGKFDHAMRQIETLGLRDALEQAAFSNRIPILGICLGMQLMTRGSDEGRMPGLGWVKAETRLINGASHNLRVPHMGWNVVRIMKPNPYFAADYDEHRFYFVHSYAVRCDEPTDILTTTEYAGEFVSSYAIYNFVGVQFHPEKSHKYGATFLYHFAAAHGLAKA